MASIDQFRKKDETVAKLALTIDSQGAIRTETLCVYTEEEYWKIIDELP